MSFARGILLIAAGVLAFYAGWHQHAGQRAWAAYALGIVAIGLGVWRLTRKADKRL